MIQDIHTYRNKRQSFNRSIKHSSWLNSSKQMFKYTITISSFSFICPSSSSGYSLCVCLPVFFFCFFINILVFLYISNYMFIYLSELYLTSFNLKDLAHQLKKKLYVPQMQYWLRKKGLTLLSLVVYAFSLYEYVCVCV